MLTGLVRPLGGLVARIPDGVAAGMLAGVLLPFSLKGLSAVEALPMVVLPMLAIFLTVRLWNPAWAVLAALAGGLVLAFATGLTTPILWHQGLPSLVLILPEFRADTALGLALPLYLVTMASQNLPGFATMRAAGFAPPVRPALVTTGALSAASGLFGAHPVSMAAITAAICLGPDTHPDPGRRWQVGLVYAGVWAVLGLISPQLLGVLAALPAPLMVALVALALLGPLMGAMAGAYGNEKHRFAATVTLVVTAAGVSFVGIGAAFWGLLAGIAVVMLETLRARAR
jgi:benzoate membrane transport protein